MSTKAKRPVGIVRVQLDLLIAADDPEDAMKSIRVNRPRSCRAWKWSVVRWPDGKVEPAWRVTEHPDGTMTVDTKRKPGSR